MYTTEYEGIVTMLKRWFAANSSEALRDWVEQFMELKTCDGCGGTRLRKESLWFKIDEKNIAELSDMNLDKLLAWLKDIEKRLIQQTKHYCKRCIERNTGTAAVPAGCGLNLS